MNIRDHQFRAGQTAGPQRAQERCSERLRLAVSDLEPEHFPAPVRSDTDGDDHGLAHHPTPDTGFVVSRVEEDIRVSGVRQGPVTERRDLLVEVRTYA